MRRKYKILLLFLLLLLILLSILMFAHSKGEISKGPLFQKVLPGDSQIDVSKVSLQRLMYEKPNGNMIFNLEKNNDSSNFKLFIDFVVDGKSAPDTVYFNSETLAFAKRHFYNAWGDYTGKLAFDSNKLSGTLSPSSEKSQLKNDLVYDKEFEHEAFEPAMLGYLIGSLPLKLGYKASLPMIDLDNGSRIIWANIEVVEKEKINVKGETYTTWKVISNGSRNKVFWISTTDNYFVKMKNKGVWFSWKLNKAL